MEKVVVIDDQEVRLRATAAVPRLYRIKFGRDILRDVMALQKEYGNAQKEGRGQDAMLEHIDLGILENIAYIMAKHANPQDVPSDVEEWLKQFQPLSLYKSFGEIIEFWTESMRGSVEPKKI